MGEFRTLRQASGWLGIAILSSEQLGHLIGGTPPSDASIGVGALLVVVAVFGPAAAALIIRAFRGSGDDAGE